MSRMALYIFSMYYSYLKNIYSKSLFMEAYLTLLKFRKRCNM